MSTARNAQMLIDRLALVFGLMLGPVLTTFEVSLDLLWTGVVGGTVAYAIHHLRKAAA
jgi:hypothetical protein